MKNRVLKVLAMVCLVAMMFSLSSSAFATSTELRSTQDFVDFLDSKGLRYSYNGMQRNGDEVTISFTLDNFESLRCYIWFKDDCEEASLRIWNIVTDCSASKADICTVLNTIHVDYKFVKYVYDPSDNTIQAELDIYIDGDHCGRSVYDAMMAMFNLTDRDDVAERLLSLR